jgi:hypothetical protein
MINWIANAEFLHPTVTEAIMINWIAITALLRLHATVIIYVMDIINRETILLADAHHRGMCIAAVQAVAHLVQGRISLTIQPGMMSIVTLSGTPSVFFRQS